jgi:hypothetical protein
MKCIKIPLLWTTLSLCILSGCPNENFEGQTPKIDFKTKNGYCGDDAKDKILANPNVTGFQCMDPNDKDLGYRPMDAFIEDLSDEINSMTLAAGDNIRMALMVICPNGVCPETTPVVIETPDPTVTPTPTPSPLPTSTPDDLPLDVIDNYIPPAPLAPPSVTPPWDDVTSSNAMARVKKRK